MFTCNPYTFGEVYVLVFCIFLDQIYFLFVELFFTYSGYKVLCQICTLQKNFSLSVACLLILLSASLSEQTFFILMKFKESLFFSFMDNAVGVVCI